MGQSIKFVNDNGHMMFGEFESHSFDERKPIPRVEEEVKEAVAVTEADPLLSYVRSLDGVTMVQIAPHEYRQLQS